MHIRDLRERKNLSQERVANAMGVSFSTFVRIEEGRATDEERERAIQCIKEMPPGMRKLGGGPPFKDPEKQRRVKEARAKNRSVAYAMGLTRRGGPRMHHARAS